MQPEENASIPPSLTPREPYELVQLLRGSAFIFAYRVGGAALTLLVQLLLARSMGASELGVYTLAFSWCVLLSNASTLGFIPAAVRFVGEGRARAEPGYVRSFVRFATRTTLLAGVCVAVVGIAIARWRLPGSDQIETMATALAIVPVLATMLFMGGLASGLSNFALGFLPSSVIRPLLFCALVALCWIRGWAIDARAAMYGNVASIIVVAVPVFVLSRALIDSTDPGPAKSFGIREAKVWLRTSTSLMVPALFTGYFSDLIVILAGFFLTPSDVAVLNICLRLAMLVTFALFAVDAFTGPQIAYAYAARRIDALETIVNRATRLRFWVALVATLAFVALGGPILAMFGEKFRAGYPLLVILACGQLVQGAVGPVVRLMGVSEHQRRSVLVFVTCFCMSVALVAALAPRFGAAGVAFAAAFVTAAWGLWIRRLAARYLGIRPRIVG